MTTKYVYQCSDCQVIIPIALQAGADTARLCPICEKAMNKDSYETITLCLGRRLPPPLPPQKTTTPPPEPRAKATTWTLYLSFLTKQCEVKVDPGSTMKQLCEDHLQPGSGHVPHEQRIAVFRKDETGDFKPKKGAHVLAYHNIKYEASLEQNGLMDGDKLAVFWQAPPCSHCEA